MLAERGRVAPWANGLPEEKEGERLDLSRRASDQLKPSKQGSVYVDDRAPGRPQQPL